MGYEFRNALSNDLAYFEAATELFGDSTAEVLNSSSVVAAPYMDGNADDGVEDRFLYIYTVPCTTESAG